MRALVFLLILSNLLFWAWTQGLLGSPESPDSLRVQQQVQADRVKIVARDEPPPELTPVPKAVKVEKKTIVEECLLLADVPADDLARLEALVKEKYPAFRAEHSMTAPSPSFWVFIPPQTNKADAERKASELKKLKVPEFFVVQEAGANRFAISLGIFSSREAAEERLADLRSKGVRSAKVGEREAKGGSGSLEIRGPGNEFDGLRQALAEWAPKNKPASCKSPRPATP